MDIEELHERLLVDLGGTFSTAMAYIGQHLGMFKSLAKTPQRAPDLAKELDLDPRYTLEWLKAMTASEYIEKDKSKDEYFLSPAQKSIFADSDSPYYMAGALKFSGPTIRQIPRIIDAFRYGGGIPYDDMEQEISCAISEFFRPGYQHNLIKEWLPAVPGLIEKLHSGINVCDIGCGHGHSTITMAQAFPKSKFIGLDYHRPSIAEATQLAKEKNVPNIEFKLESAEELKSLGVFDLVCAFDCIHDMPQPQKTLKSIAEALSPNGQVFWIEPKGSSDPVENRSPIGRLFQNVSPLHCLTVSMAHRGVGLGTIIGVDGAEKLARDSGLKFKNLNLDSPIHLFHVLSR